jgi:dTDP-4-amino-4,6-dideoxy-D-glucose acyltransferase
MQHLTAAYLTREEIAALGFASIGVDVQLSRKASFYGCERISIADNVRIDDFCVLSAGNGGIDIASHIHIAVYSSLIGAGKISLGDFCNLSSRVSIFSSSDDYSGTTMTNPTVPNEYKSVRREDVSIGRHVVIGSGSVVLPGVRIEEGVAVGALSLVNGSCNAFGVYAGIPATRVRERKRDLLQLEVQMRMRQHG